MSINFNEHVYGSRAIVFHKQIIMKQTLNMYIESICFFSIHITSYHDQVINFELRHKYYAAATEYLFVALQ